MRSALDRVDVVDVSADRFVVTAGILERDVDLDPVLRTARVNDVLMRDFLAVQIVDEIDDAMLVVEVFPASVAQIMELNVDAR